MASVERDPALLFAAPEVLLSRREDGAMLLSSPQPLGAYSRCIGVDLEHWADAAPQRLFLAERAAVGAWRELRYGEARRQVRQIAASLLRMKLPPGRPVAVLSDNGIEHALLMLACLHVGIPYAAVSPAYSLMSQDHAKLRALVARLQPALLYTASAARYAPALAAIAGLHDAVLVASDTPDLPVGALPFSSLLTVTDERAVQAAFEAVGPDTVAKILFTSGSISEPKGVINTQRMLCASQQAKAQVWPFLARTPPVIVDWLPWNHTFGGNHNFNLVLRHGGTLYIDGGKPAAGLCRFGAAAEPVGRPDRTGDAGDRAGSAHDHRLGLDRNLAAGHRLPLPGAAFGRDRFARARRRTQAAACRRQAGNPGARPQCHARLSRPGGADCKGLR
jgi:feruloyl-CoA synthase